MPDRRREITRADLPEELTTETVRRLPLATLRRLAEPGNGILDPEEQAAFDAVLHEVMSTAAGRVSGRINRSDWASVMRDANRRGPKRGGPGRSAQVDEQLRRLASRIDEQVGVAESLAPGVDWSFAQAPEPAEAPASTAPPATDAPEETDEVEESDDQGETVSDLEQRLTEQVELVQLMSEIADVSKRTYELEQQRDLQTTRGVFFGFVVSVAVLVAGWAPIVAADDWAERGWTLGLTLGTCVVAGLVYALVRRWQDRPRPETD